MASLAANLVQHLMMDIEDIEKAQLSRGSVVRGVSKDKLKQMLCKKAGFSKYYCIST
jgi:hypothetical protein